MGLLDELDKVLGNNIRLSIMSVLVVNDWVDFNQLKTLLSLTDGNLASHITAMEKEEYIEVKKEFVGKKPKTSYRSTELGRTAFKRHLEAIEKLLSQSKKA